MKFKSIAVTAIFVSINMQAVDFNEAVATLADHNLNLQAQRAADMADLMSRKTENNLPDPEIEFESLWGNKGDRKMGGGVAQSFEWFGVYGARSKAYKAASRLAQINESARRFEVEAEISRMLIDYISAINTKMLLQQMVDGYEKMRQAQQEGYDNRKVSIIDLNKIKIELVKNRVRLDECYNTISELEGRLSELAPGIDVKSVVDDLVDFPIDVLYPLERYLQAVDTRDPIIMRAIAQIEVDKADVSVASRSSLPSFSLGWVWEHEDGQFLNGFSIGVSVPIFSNKGKANAAKMKSKTSDFALTAARSSAEALLKARYEQAKSLKRQMDEYGPIIESNDNLSLLKRAYDGGQIDLTTYLQDVNYFLDAHLTFHELTARYHQVMVELNRYL